MNIEKELGIQRVKVRTLDDYSLAELFIEKEKAEMELQYWQDQVTNIDNALFWKRFPKLKSKYAP